MKTFRAMLLAALAAILLLSSPAAFAKKYHPTYKVKPVKGKIKPVVKHHWYSRSHGHKAGRR